jgi:MoaA/NifB/PqqE/SkfB family radical SAM enzyme
MTPIEIKRDSSKNQYFQINWMLHDRCTYACSYCPPGNHAGSDAWLKIDKAIDICKNIESQVKLKYPDLGMQVLLGGGEPTVWKDFPELARYFYQSGWSIHMVTNLSRSLNWWKSLDIRWNTIGISLHAEYADESSLAEKIEYLLDHCDTVKLRVMLHPKDGLFQKSIDIANNLKSKFPDLIVMWVSILHEFGGTHINISQYSDEQRTVIDELVKKRMTGRQTQTNDTFKKIVWNNNITTGLNGQYLVNVGLNKFSNWECDAGLDGLFIDGSGNITRGTCREGGTIGHILDSDFKLPDEPIICSLKSCTCVTDVLYSKRKIN